MTSGFMQVASSSKTNRRRGECQVKRNFLGRGNKAQILNVYSKTDGQASLLHHGPIAPTPVKFNHSVTSAYNLHLTKTALPHCLPVPKTTVKLQLTLTMHVSLVNY